MLRFQTRFRKIGFVLVVSTDYGREIYRYNSLAHEIISVQPMVSPTGQIFSMKVRYQSGDENG